MFPMTVTIHNSTQLAALMAAMSQPETALTHQERAAVTATEKEAVANLGKSSKAAAKTEAAASTKPTATEQKADAQDKRTTEASPTTPPAAAPAASPATQSELTYEVVGKAITEGVKTNRQHVVDVLKKFGATKGPELKQEQWADFLAELQGA